ncbi:Uncharacterized protein YtfN [hydrothermal vent metagenome]|uniref:Uncharacterized protein YtfN n=1 Tax=hydrothermal vent metagenome TaxID=652676 RepID=A0A1W1CII6_9ZZZZ
MQRFKKFFYGFLIFFVILLAAVVFAANSSWVIKKAADRFAPDYNISYSDITGNLFTGVQIDGLAFDRRPLIDTVRFSWDPSRLLYKRLQINTIVLDGVDVDSIKALAASFPASDEDNSTSGPFPLVVNVKKMHITLKPFRKEGIAFKKTVADMKDFSYAADRIAVGNLQTAVDSNLTDITLDASLKDRTLLIKALSVTNIDTEALQKRFLTEDDNRSAAPDTAVPPQTANKEPLNVFIPLHVKLNHFFASVKPRFYKNAKIGKIELHSSGLNVNVLKVLDQKGGAVEIADLSALAESSIGTVDMDATWKKDTVTIEHLTAKKIDTKALQALFASEDNSTAEKDSATATAVQEQNTSKEMNPMVPHYVLIRSFETSLLPATYAPVHLLDFKLKADNLKLDTRKLLIEQGVVDLNATSNLSNVLFQSTITDNVLKGKTHITPNKGLFTLYDLPIRKEAIGDVVIGIDASPKRIVADLKAKAEQLLVTQENNESNATAFNVDIDSLKSHVVFTVKNKKLNADTKMILTTPYAKNISVSNIFVLDRNISYHGEVKAKKIIGLDANLTKPLQNLHIVYKGDTKSIDTRITSEGLSGVFVSNDFKQGRFHLETTKALLIDKMAPLPPQLEGAKANFQVDVPVNFAKITPIRGKVKLTSNLTDLNAEIFYAENIKVKAVSTIPKDSLLKNFDKNIKWDALSPMNIDLALGAQALDLTLKANAFATTLEYLPRTGKVDGKVKLGALTTVVSGNAKKKIAIRAKVDSFESLTKSFQNFYTIEGLPKVEGGLNLSVDINALKSADLTLSSPQIIYKPDRDTEHSVTDVKMVVAIDKSTILLKQYTLTYQKMKLFATKPSKVMMKDDMVTIEPFWLNDQLQVTGNYNLKTKKGKIIAQADKLHIAQEMIDLDSKIDVTTLLDGEKTVVKGKITLLDGTIHYDMGKKSFASDSDIVIVQNMKKKEASPFMDNLSIDLKIDSVKPLIYKEGPVNMKAYVDLKVLKTGHSDLLVLGSVKLKQGGSYEFQGKRFVIKKGNIYLTGNPNRPILDIEVTYQAPNHLITIAVAGTPEAPVLNFSSRPSLSQEQILSVILFDSEAGAGSNSSEDMMKMMGGAMAKSALSDMGVKIDHLVLGQHGNVEIGKKLTKKITVIYINDEIPSVEVKYRHSKRTESILKFDEISQSYDIVYKRDMSADDIVKFAGGKKKK